MKAKVVLLVVLAGVVVLFYSYNRGIAASKVSGQGEKVGVVSVLKVFNNCEKNTKFREAAIEEERKIREELDLLGKEIEFEEAGLKKLKVGSADRLERVKVILEKRSMYQAHEEFYKQERVLKEQRWAEEIYKDILEMVADIAGEQGLDIVLEKTEPELPANSYSELMTIISTHKVLYSGGVTVDITEEVVKRLDAAL